LIGPAGGWVARGGVLVEIPAGALSEPARIGITLLPGGAIDLIPDGQTFNRPVLLHLSAPAGADPGRCQVQWYDPVLHLWTTIVSSADSAGRVASLGHFSAYRLIDDLQ
jgi:hypothetical protein